MEDNQDTLGRIKIDEKVCIKQAMIEDIRILTILAIEHICESGFNDERKLRNINTAVELSSDILKGVDKL